MRRADTITLAARVLTLPAAAAAALLLPPAVLAALLMLTPVCCVCMEAEGRNYDGAAILAVTGVCACLAGQAWQVCVLAGLWAGAALLMALLPQLRPYKRKTLGWFAITVAMLCAALVMLRTYFDGMITQGLAELLTDSLSAGEDSNRLLLTLYQLGYARLEGEMTEMPAVELFGRVILNPEVRTELINSLRTTLKYLLNEQLPGWLTTYLMVMGLLTAVLPECIRRKCGMDTTLPPVHRLYLDQKAARGAWMLILFGLARFMTASLAVYQAAGMAMTAFSILYSAQGVCLIAWWRHRSYESRINWLTIVLLAVLMLPMLGTLLMILGAADQLADLRKLREKDKDIEGGT